MISNFAENIRDKSPRVTDPKALAAALSNIGTMSPRLRKLYDDSSACFDDLAAEIERFKHNERVLVNALYKACGDDEEMVRQIIESQGVLRPDPALLARCPTGKCDDPARDCFGSGCLGPNK